MKVDFHMHSTVSDGTNSPTEMVQLTEVCDYCALTDHDEVGGCPEFVEAVNDSKTKRIAGAEFSIETSEGVDTFHLLGLGFRLDSVELQDFLIQQRALRDERNVQIINKFKNLGFEVDAKGDSVYDIAGTGVLGRPHFAIWLIKHGYVKDFAEAFARYLAKDAPKKTSCYVARRRSPQEEAIQVIHKAGGIAIMAHPRQLRRVWKKSKVDFDFFKGLLPPLIEKGLDGVEAIYSDNSPQENERFTQIANDFHLLKTAGSDYHGTFKPWRKIGMAVEDTFINPFLEAVNLI